MITKEYLQQELRRRIEGIKPGVETTTDNIIAEMKSILVLVDALNDYEKKYNEALERAKEYLDFYKDNPEQAQKFVDIFPELRESEDERIRKVIHKLLLGMRKEIFTSQDDIVTKDKALAWLEKQKVPTPADWSEEDKDKVAQYLHDRDGGMLWSKATEITSDILDMLCPRPSWKPSEEQMSSLRDVITMKRAGNEFAETRLREIYEQLQKL